MAFIENFIGNLVQIAATDTDTAGGEEPAEEAQLWVWERGEGEDKLGILAAMLLCNLRRT